MQCNVHKQLNVYQVIFYELSWQLLLKETGKHTAPDWLNILGDGKGRGSIRPC